MRRVEHKTTISDKCHKDILFTNYCDDCDETESIYDGKETALFVVDAASSKPSLRTITASGTIKRGRFEVGDKVQIISSLETRDAIIASIIRQGAKIDYANVSSGPIGLVFANVSDMMIRSGDKIVKQRPGFLR